MRKIHKSKSWEEQLEGGTRGKITFASKMCQEKLSLSFPGPCKAQAVSVCGEQLQSSVRLRAHNCCSFGLGHVALP